MRIAHITATFPPYQGGTGNVCRHSARELARRGHEVHVFTAGQAGLPATEARDGYAIRRLRPLVRIGNAPVLPGLPTALRRFDIVHLHYPFMLGAEMARLGAALTRTPLVLSFHNDLIGDGARAVLFTLYQRLSAQLTVRSAAALCAVSLDHYRSSRLRRMLDRAEPPIVDLPNGVDTALFRPLGLAENRRAAHGIPADARLLLFVAALDRAHHFKGLPTLLEAMPRLSPDVWLLVVGDGDLRATYEQQAARSAAAGRIVFAGAIAHEQTPAYFRCADLTVLPSTPPESFGLVLIESLACGTPVVASNIPGVRTVVDDGLDGRLAPPGDPAALAAVIQDVLDSESARISMGRRGREKVVARYSWGQIGARLEQIYLTAMRDARAHPPAPARDSL